MEIQIGERDIVDDVEEDMDVCRECSGTWKVACYGAWYPHSQFWDDFLEDGWEDGVCSPQSCCLRFVCGMLFCVLAPVWCCKAILFFLCWPCVCVGRALKNGQCNKTYFRVRHSNERTLEKRKSEPLAYIEPAQPSHPTEIPYSYSTSNVPPESPIPEIRIETEQDNGTYVTSPVEDVPADYSPLPGTVRRTIIAQMSDSDLPPAYPSSEEDHSHRARGFSDAPLYMHTTVENGKSSSSSAVAAGTHSTASKTMSVKAKGMDNNLYRAIVLEGFQGITGKVTSV